MKLTNLVVLVLVAALSAPGSVFAMGGMHGYDGGWNGPYYQGDQGAGYTGNHTNDNGAWHGNYMMGGNGTGYGHNMRWGGGPQSYNQFTVDTSGDFFTNSTTFHNMTGGQLTFVDENGDGILDYVQDTPAFQQLGIGPFEDTNGDTIHDAFQTYDTYRMLGMGNFVDVNGDGICDNYTTDPADVNATWGPGYMSGGRHYNMFQVNTDGDLFINPGTFNSLTGGRLMFVDDNGDGVCDYFQDTPYFDQLGIGPFEDTNGDSIHDAFQTYGAYRMLGLNNFVDVDGDGICDNYEANPFVTGQPVAP